MQSVKKGDFILHNAGGRIASISCVRKGCYSADQPDELHNSQNTYEWDNDGYRVDTEYYDFDMPLLNADIALWAANHQEADSCFDVNGRLKLRYLCNVANSHAEYLVKMALNLQREDGVKKMLHRALEMIRYSESS